MVQVHHYVSVSILYDADMLCAVRSVSAKQTFSVRKGAKTIEKLERLESTNLNLEPGGGYNVPCTQCPRQLFGQKGRTLPSPRRNCAESLPFRTGTHTRNSKGLCDISSDFHVLSTSMTGKLCPMALTCTQTQTLPAARLQDAAGLELPSCSVLTVYDIRRLLRQLCRCRLVKPNWTAKAKG